MNRSRAITPCIPAFTKRVGKIKLTQHRFLMQQQYLLVVCALDIRSIALVQVVLQCLEPPLEELSFSP